MGRYISDYKTKESRENENPLPSKEHYASIMQRLTGEGSGNMSKSYVGVVNNPFHSTSRDTKLTTIYNTTPSKRKKIFD